MRNTIAKTTLAAAIFVLASSTAPTQAPAGEPGSVADILQRACTVSAGRFEEKWAYNDTGVQWGAISTCVTEEIRLTCQDDVCRATGANRSYLPTVLAKQKASPDLGVAVRPEREEFGRILTSTAMY